MVSRVVTVLAASLGLILPLVWFGTKNRLLSAVVMFTGIISQMVLVGCYTIRSRMLKKSMQKKPSTVMPVSFGISLPANMAVLIYFCVKTGQLYHADTKSWTHNAI